MGRKRKKPIGTLDRIGEEVDLTKCPECADHPDCFSWMEGRCTALNVSDGRGCVFYCPAQKAVDKSKIAYEQLKETGRDDLIGKYIKPLIAMGVLDDEIDEFDRTAEKLERFREEDFEALMKETPRQR